MGVGKAVEPIVRGIQGALVRARRRGRRAAEVSPSEQEDGVGRSTSLTVVINVRSVQAGRCRTAEVAPTEEVDGVSEADRPVDVDVATDFGLELRGHIRQVSSPGGFEDEFTFPPVLTGDQKGALQRRSRSCGLATVTHSSSWSRCHMIPCASARQ